MKLPTTSLIILSTLLSAHVSKACDISCRQQCVANKEGDECVTKCGCQTLSEELMN